MDLSLLTLYLDEPDPIEEAKHKITSISLIVWFVHQWQLADEDEETARSLARRIKQETDLSKSQLRIIGRINKTDTEPVILRYVTEALATPPSNME